MGKSRRKPLDKFRLILPRHTDGYATVGGTYTEYGYSPLHALSNLLRKMNCQNFVDTYYTRFTSGMPDTDIRLFVNGTTESTRRAPELKALREYIALRTGKAKKEVEQMRYSSLYQEYTNLVAPVPIQVISSKQPSLFHNPPKDDSF